MKKRSFYSVAWVAFSFAFMLSSVTAPATGEKGTLMGNPEGTKFCCAAGTNDCAAVKCSTNIE